MLTPWVGIDLDGTLAAQYWPHAGEYDPARIGDPIPAMVLLVRRWRAAGIDVRIFTARIAGDEMFPTPKRIASLIQAWCLVNIGESLPVTCVKDRGMVELWDDRAIRVIHNTGRPCCQERSVLENKPAAL